MKSINMPTQHVRQCNPHSHLSHLHYAYPTHFLFHIKIVFLQNFFNFVVHSWKSAIAYSIQTPIHLPYICTHPFYFYHPLTQLFFHHDIHTPTPFPDNHISFMLLLLSTPLHQRAASRVQHPKSCGSQQSLPPGGKERLHFVGIRPEVQARKGGW